MARLVIGATWAWLAGAKTIALVTFDGAEQTTHKWREMNDPVMGGRSTGTFSLGDGVGIFDGEVVDVPFLQAPGFIKCDTVDRRPFPDVAACEALQLEVRAASAYPGYRVSFGDAKPPGGKFFAFGYKSHFDAPVGDFGQVTIPFSNFTDFWDDGTGEPIKTCQDAAMYCPSAEALQNLKTVSIWAEGKKGKVHLEIKSISAVGCKESMLV